uniref:Calmodulin-binding domain-containing protein n=1 Tax=Parascaris equorum TaxID=6256 RepID=A0A914RT11_PAREQ
MNVWEDLNKFRIRFIHKYKKSCAKGDDLRIRQHQRRFLHAINEFRRIKWDQLYSLSIILPLFITFIKNFQ